MDELARGRSVDETKARIEIMRRFLRMMSHELRTPITALQLQMCALEAEAAGSTTPDIGRIVPRMARACRRLVYLTDTVVEWVRVEAGRCRLVVDPLNLEQLVQETVQDLGDLATARNVSVRIQKSAAPKATLCSDRRLVQIILVNLIARAIQVSQREVEIGIESGEAEGRISRILVRDTGAPVDDGADVLDPLTSDVLHRRSGAGAGLDLYVVRDLARALDGNLVRCASNDGNTFAFEIPDLSSPDDIASGPSHASTNVGDESMIAGLFEVHG